MDRDPFGRTAGLVAMSAIAIDRHPEWREFPQVLQLRNLQSPVPSVRHGEVRLRVEASGINVDNEHLGRAVSSEDFRSRQDRRPSGPGDRGRIPTGKIEALGVGVIGFELGQRV